MESEHDMRLSDSPQRTPQISNPIDSPPRSVRPEYYLDSLNSQADFRPRRLNFFDDASSDSVGTVEASRPSTENDKLKMRARIEQNEQQLLTSELLIPENVYERRGDWPSNHSCRIDAPLHQRARSSPSSICSSAREALEMGLSNYAHQSSIPSRSGTARVPHRSANVDNLRERARSDAAQVKADKILSAHKIAHQITLQALMQQDDDLNNAWSGGDRSSTLRPSSHVSDAQSRFGRPVSTSNNRQTNPNHIVYRTTSQDTQLPLPESKTPYDRHEERSQQDNAIPSVLCTPNERVLHLSIRPRSTHIERRFSTIRIPASKEFTVVKSSPHLTKDLYFRALEYDDATFFKEMRRQYKTLTGIWKHIGARTLKRIVVINDAFNADNNGCRVSECRLLSPHRHSISEEELLRHFHNPLLGRSKWCFVDWIQRHALVGPIETPRPACGSREKQQVEVMWQQSDAPIQDGWTSNRIEIEFILSWSLKRIATLLAVVILASIAVTLCWVFLGKSSTGANVDGGYRDAGDRVAAGVLMGIAVILLGLSALGGWLGASWLAT